jgi:N-acetylneuraminic acid mutarotase
MFIHRAISLKNSVYIIGGRYASTGRLSNAVFKYDTETDFWRTCDSMKAPRYFIFLSLYLSTIFFMALSINFAVTIFESKIYVLGGEGLKGVIVQSVEAYDPVVNSWKEVGTFAKPKRNHASCSINGKLWSCGGASSLLDAKSSNELVLVNELF